MHDCEQSAESENVSKQCYVNLYFQEIPLHLSCSVSVERLSTDSCPRKLDVLKTNISLRGEICGFIDSFKNIKFRRKTIGSILLRHKLFTVAIVQRWIFYNAKKKNKKKTPKLAFRMTFALAGFGWLLLLSTLLILAVCRTRVIKNSVNVTYARHECPSSPVVRAPDRCWGRSWVGFPSGTEIFIFCPTLVTTEYSIFLKLFPLFKEH